MNINMSDVKRQERALWQGLIVDLVGFFPTLVVALLSGSLLLLSDVFDFLRNLAVSSVSLHILRRIRKGQTVNYDYGAGKLECLGSLIGASLFIAGLLGLAAAAILRLQDSVELHLGFTAIGLLIHGVNMFVDCTLWFRNKRIARETDAPLIDMQWRHNRTDALASGAVIIALILMLLMRDTSWATYIDPVCTLIYVMFSICLYIPGVRNNLSNLLDQTLEEDLQFKIMRRLAEHFDQYEGFHGIRSRRAGARIFVEIILSFNPEHRVRETVETIRALRRDLQSDIPHSEVNVIIEPLQRQANPIENDHRSGNPSGLNSTI